MDGKGKNVRNWGIVARQRRQCKKGRKVKELCEQFGKASSHVE